MYAFIKGSIFQVLDESVIVESNNIGYLIHAPKNLLFSLTVGEIFTFHTSFVVREDSQRLFGFQEIEEKKLFEKLTSISGLGPKTALAIIGTSSRASFENAIIEKDVSNLTKIPGIGKKTAERIIIELQGKFKKNSLQKRPGSNDAVKALTSLGIKEHIALQKVSDVLKTTKKDLSIEEIVTLCISAKSS